ncbi:hypothetical protein VitviT2T_000059 [Vitis vinifera]|uniref:Peptidase M16 N-terminal domain-containing protein n=1 Tax=Vitis vinifera TaxID=29760 RepID=A0ABY9BCS7_VITVI|nr:hypothetical protein VitviT2T_000059 [Vitis vinifera]
MAIRRLLNLSGRRSHSAAVTTATLSPPPPPPSSSSSSSSTTMIYDRAADTVKSKLKRLETPDSRFLRYTSPHPILADHSATLSSPETRVTTLPNGLRVATESRLPGRAAAVGVWIDSGSRFESDATNGVAHFLERMVFKGTEKRPARVLVEEIGSMGGHLSACTSREHTAYCAEVMDENVPKALDLLSDMLQHSCFREDQMERERDLILQQIKEAEGPSKDIIFDHLHATAFQYTPLGRTVLGSAKNIKTIHKSHIKDYISAHCAAHRMVFN